MIHFFLKLQYNIIILYIKLIVFLNQYSTNKLTLLINLLIQILVYYSMKSFIKKNFNGKEDKNYFCPYCSSVFPTKKIMSKHVDDIHIGRGLLEGDMRNW